MVKLYGKDLDDALERRKKFKEERLNKKLTLRKAAKIIGKELGLSPEEYMEFEAGHDICPHEDVRTIWAGFPPAFFVDRCVKCGFMNNLRDINDEEAFNDYKKSYPNGFEATEEEWKGTKSNDNGLQ